MPGTRWQVWQVWQVPRVCLEPEHLEDVQLAELGGGEEVGVPLGQALRHGAHLVHGAWCMLLVQGACCWCMVQGAWCKVQGSWRNPPPPRWSVVRRLPAPPPRCRGPLSTSRPRPGTPRPRPPAARPRPHHQPAGRNVWHRRLCNSCGARRRAVVFTGEGYGGRRPEVEVGAAPPHCSLDHCGLCSASLLPPPQARWPGGRRERREGRGSGGRGEWGPGRGE